MPSFESDVLVLNTAWLPINTTSKINALCELFCGKAKALDENYVMHDFASWVETWDDAAKIAKIERSRVLHSPNLKLVAPEIIVVKNFDGNVRRRPKLSRSAIYSRDRNTCQYCGNKFSTKELNIDHVTPKAQGGRSTWKNLVLSCVKCNQKKGNRTPEQANMLLLRKPFEPHWSVIKTLRDRDLPKSWEGILGKMYWECSLEKD